MEGIKMEPIAIIGMGCRFPGGSNDPEKFWNILKNGIDATSDVPSDRWDMERYYDPDKTINSKTYTFHGGFIDKISDFDASFFGISPREAEYLDPQQRILLEVSWEAMEDAGINPASLRGKDVGVFIGAFTLDYKIIQFNHKNMELFSSHTATGSMMTMLSNRISYIYDFKGPSMSIDTACSSSLVSVHLACKSILNNECSMAIAGGVNVITTPEYFVAESKGGFLSPDGRCKTWDASANGYARGEGAGIIVLKKLSKALEDGDIVYAVIRESGVNQDGHTNGITVPNGQSQELIMKEVYNRAGIMPGEVKYVEAHGTGTSVGDPIEVNAIANVMSIGRQKENKCIIGSVKTNISHLESASGIAGMIKSVLILRNRQIPPHLHFKNPNPKIPFNELSVRVPITLEPWPEDGNADYIGVNSFGFGGTNAHILLEGVKINDCSVINDDISENEDIRPFIVPFSARSENALKELAGRYAQLLKEECNKDTFSLKDIVHSIKKHRAYHDKRLAVLAGNKEELLEKLEAYEAGQMRPGMVYGKADSEKYSKVVFVYTGMGPIWWAMGRQLLDKEPVFRATILKCDEIIRHYAGWSLMEELTADENLSRLDQPQYAQPANFAVQVALTELWKSLGINPDAVIGHSVGEVAVAYVSGIYSLEDAVLVSIERSIVQQKAANKGGSMLAVGLSMQEMEKKLEGVGSEICISAVNSPTSVTLSGNREVLDSFRAKLEEEGIFAKLLKVNVAYHSYQMDPYRDELLEALKPIKIKSASIPVYSTVTGFKEDGSDYCGDYWWKNVRGTVYFEKAMYEIIKDGYNLFVEVGPHPVLAGYINECMSVKKVEGKVLPSIKRNGDEQIELIQSLGALSTLGYPVDFDRVNPNSGKYIKLPLYPWQRESYWNETEESLEIRTGKNKHKILGDRLISKNPTWEKEINLNFMSFYSDHKIQGSEVFPAAGYIEMGLAAAREYYGEGFYSIENINIEKALFIKQSGNWPKLQLIMYPHDASFEICSKSGVNGHSWIKHVTGRIDKRQSYQQASKAQIKEICSRCPVEMSKEDCYSLFDKMGFNYGPAFQGVQKVWKSDVEGIGIIEVPEYIDLEDTTYSFHPAILDSCLHVMLAVVKQDFLPVGIEKLHIYGRPKRTMYCHAIEVENSDKSSKSNFFIYDEEGNLIADIICLKTQSMENSGASLAGSPEKWLYGIDWVKADNIGDGKNRRSPDVSKPGAWIIFEDGEGLGRELAANLVDKGEKCCFVRPLGDNSCKEDVLYINPSSLSEVKSLFEKIVERGLNIKGVVHMWSLDAIKEQDISIPVLMKIQEKGCLTLKHIVQVVSDEELAARLWIVTRGTLLVDEASKEQSVAQASIVGLARIIGHQEARANWGGIVDLDPEKSQDEVGELFGEIWIPDEEDQIAFRNDDRYVPRLMKRDFENKALPAKFCADGSYIVTGAFGALGMLVARWMLERGAKHLVLMGRGSFPDRKDWKNVESGSAMAERIAFIKELESKGATVHIAAVDVGEEEQLVNFIEQYKEEGWPVFRGVIHSAGLVADKLIQQMDDDTFLRVIKPKVFGGWNLHKHLKDFPLEFFILFSSTGSIIASMGQANYASGNAFLDALSNYRVQNGMPALSINWGPWGEIGMVEKLNLTEFFKNSGMDTIKPSAGLADMELLMSQNVSQAAVIPAISWSKFCRSHFPGYGAFPMISHLEKLDDNQESDNKNKKNGILQKLTNCDFGQKMDIIELHLRELIANVFKYDAEKLDTKEPLVNFGLDSMLASEIRSKIEMEFGSSVSVVELLKGSSVIDLASKLLQKLEILEDVETNSLPDEPQKDEKGFYPLAATHMTSLFKTTANVPENVDKIIRQEDANMERVKNEIFFTQDIVAAAYENDVAMQVPEMSLEKKELKINFQQDITVYLYRALPLYVILSDKRLHNWYYERFINIYSQKDNNGFVTLDFVEYWCPYKGFIIENCLGYKLLENIPSIIDFVIERINSDFYIIINVDEYYLPEKSNYKKKHFVHESMIYGYDNSQKRVMALGYNAEGILNKITFSYDDLIVAFENGKKYYKWTAPWAENSAVQTIKLNDYKSDYPFEIGRFLKELRDYINSTADSERAYCLLIPTERLKFGFDIYDSVIDSLKNLYDGQITIDYRAIHLLYEHKKLIHDRLEFVISKFGLTGRIVELSGEYQKIVNRFTAIRFKFLELQHEVLSSGKPTGKRLEYESGIMSFEFEVVFEPSKYTSSIKELIEEIKFIKSGEKELLSEVFHQFEEYFSNDSLIH